MTASVNFTVYGQALPKGSARAFMPKGARFPVVTSTTRGLKEWERMIAAAAQGVTTGTLITGPVLLTLAFLLDRPKSLPKKIVHHTKRPDLDKLVRAATDALTGVLWKDDAQVVSIIATKTYATESDDAPRVEFSITEAV